MSTDLLFRGVNAGQHRHGKCLHPKQVGSFTYGSRYGEAAHGTGWTYGTTTANAVVKHQLKQEGFPTAGISTTPVYERAVFYATGGGRHPVGYIYKIDRGLLPMHDVAEYVVSHYTVAASVPQDSEVILVAGDGGELPSAIVIEIVEVICAPSV